MSHSGQNKAMNISTPGFSTQRCRYCEKVSSQSTRARLGHYRSIAGATNGPTPKVPEHHHNPHSVPLRHRQRSHARIPRDFFALLELDGWHFGGGG